MKETLIIFFLVSFTFSVHSQNKRVSSSYKIVRSNLGVGGSSKIINTSKGKYSVSQSIGQASVVGTYQSKGYYLRQGYQQPMHKITIEKHVNNTLNAQVFPNPFEASVSVSFNEKLSNNIYVRVFDVSGRQVYTRNLGVSNKTKLYLDDIASGTYFLKVSSGSKSFNAKLIKK